MNSKDLQVLQKLIKHGEAICAYCEPYVTLEAFQENTMCVEATVFNLMQIGELAKFSLSEEAKQRIRAIPWPQLYGMRNRIVHGYDGVNMTIVWDTIKEDIPVLLVQLKRAVGE